MSTAQKIKDQMAANSAAWHGASKKEQDRLHAANQQLAKDYAKVAGGGPTYNSTTGTWSTGSTPFYTVNNSAAGGSAVSRGNRGALKPTTSSVAGITGQNAAQQARIDEMDRNSKEWHTATPERRAQLEARNQAIASELKALGLNLRYDNYSGSWSVVNPNVSTMMGVPTMDQVYMSPALMGQPLGDIYGLTYDYDTILRMLTDATKASYGAQREEFQTTENKFYRDILGSQQDTLNMLRQQQAQAVATGASKGIAAANELSAILNLQDVSAEGATELANQRNLLMSKEAEALAQNTTDALDTSNSLKSAIAGLDMTKYGYDVQQLIGKLDFLAAKHTADTTLEGVKYNADQNLAGTQYTADQNLAGVNVSRGGNNYFSGGSGSGSYYGGSGKYATTSDGKEAKTSEGKKIINGKTMAWDAFLDSGEPAYALPGTNMVAVRQDNGSFNLELPDGNHKTQLTERDVRAIIMNNNDINAALPGYGVDEFNNLVSTTVGTGSSKTGNSRLEIQGGKEKIKDTEVKKGNLISGTKITYTNRAETNTFTWIYDAAKTGWVDKHGSVMSVTEMNKRLKNGELYNYKIKYP